MSTDQLIAAVVAALTGGAGLKLIETLITYVLNKQGRTLDWETSRRQELDAERQALKNDIKVLQDKLDVEVEDLQQEIDQWKGKYYELLEKHVTALADYRAAILTVETLQQRVNDLKSEIDLYKERKSDED